MAFRSKRRKPRVVWLPQWTEDRIFTSTITNGNQNAPGDYDLAYLGGGARTDFVFGVVHDYQPSMATTPGLNGLADLYSSGYRLRRIVGSLHVTHTQTAVGAGPFPSIPTGCLCSVGFIVLKVNPETQDPLDAAASRYSTLSLDNTSDPWIWRRSWQLADTNLWVANGNGGRIGAFLRSNSEYGDIRSGTHIDAKTARVISLEERLFMVVSVISYDGDIGVHGGLAMTTDIRFLASLRQNIGNRNNSTR